MSLAICIDEGIKLCPFGQGRENHSELSFQRQHRVGAYSYPERSTSWQIS